MKTDYVGIGAQYTDSDAKRVRLQEAIDGMTWQTVPPDGPMPMPMMQGMAINMIVRDLRLCPVALAWDGVLDGLAVIGLQLPTHQALYVIDDGCQAAPVRLDTLDAPSTDPAAPRPPSA